jgi:CheY-like chemotaxis protein
MTIYLPASTKVIRDKEEAPATESFNGKGKILIMDDDEIVRKVAVQMLHHFGYAVTESTHGEEALALYRSALDGGEPFDLVILDLTVPGKMGGKDTVAKLMEIDPGVKAIVSSGYSHDPIMAQYKKYGFAGVVPKPYSLEKMGETVQSILSSTS